MRSRGLIFLSYLDLRKQNPRKQNLVSMYLT